MIKNLFIQQLLLETCPCSCDYDNNQLNIYCSEDQNMSNLSNLSINDVKVNIKLKGKTNLDFLFFIYLSIKPI